MARASSNHLLVIRISCMKHLKRLDQYKLLSISQTLPTESTSGAFSPVLASVWQQWGSLCVLWGHPAQHSPEHSEQALPYLQPSCSHSSHVGEQRHCTHRQVTVQMVTKVEHLGSTPARQPQEIKEVALQVTAAQSETWLQATPPRAGVSTRMGCQFQQISLPHHLHPEVSVLPHLTSLSSHVTTP